MATSSAEVLRVDPASCRPLWKAYSDAPLGEYSVQLGPRAVWLSSGKSGLRRFSLSDGAAMEGVADPFVSFLLTRETAYVLRTSSLEARMVTSPKQSRWVANIPPPFQAERMVASDSFVAVLATSGAPPTPKYRLLAYSALDGQAGRAQNRLIAIPPTWRQPGLVRKCLGGLRRAAAYVA